MQIQRTRYGSGRLAKGRFGSGRLPKGRFGSGHLAKGRFGSGGLAKGRFGGGRVPAGRFGSALNKAAKAVNRMQRVGLLGANGHGTLKQPRAHKKPKGFDKLFHPNPKHALVKGKEAQRGSAKQQMVDRARHIESQLMTRKNLLPVARRKPHRQLVPRRGYTTTPNATERTAPNKGKVDKYKVSGARQLPKVSRWNPGPTRLNRIWSQFTPRFGVANFNSHDGALGSPMNILSPYENYQLSQKGPPVLGPTMAESTARVAAQTAQPPYVPRGAAQ